MVLGVAGGNGLEHVDPARIRTVYGVDLNRDYLAACARRYPALSNTLVCLEADLTAGNPAMPKADLVIANLLVEYIGYSCFQRVLIRAEPDAVSCAVQVNTGEDYVSESPYLHAFDHLEEVHHIIDSSGLTVAMTEIGYRLTLRTSCPLPNGKHLLRLDYEKRASSPNFWRNLQ